MKNTRVVFAARIYIYIIGCKNGIPLDGCRWASGRVVFAVRIYIYIIGCKNGTSTVTSQPKFMKRTKIVVNKIIYCINIQCVVGT